MEQNPFFSVIKRYFCFNLVDSILLQMCAKEKKRYFLSKEDSIMSVKTNIYIYRKLVADCKMFYNNAVNVAAIEWKLYIGDVS